MKKGTKSVLTFIAEIALMVVITTAVQAISNYLGVSYWIVLPAVVILFISASVLQGNSKKQVNQDLADSNLELIDEVSDLREKFEREKDSNHTLCESNMDLQDKLDDMHSKHLEALGLIREYVEQLDKNKNEK